MTTTRDCNTGSADIDEGNPFALIERIRFLVRHEHDYSHYASRLEGMIRDRPSEQWHVPRKFLALLKDYEHLLDMGVFGAEEMRGRAADFDLHRSAMQEPT